MILELEIQNASRAPNVPADALIRRWARSALGGRRERAQLSVRVVDEAEGADLNHRFRGRRKATNVLSFPFGGLPGLEECALLGDLVICAPVVAREAADQGKSLDAHWAHMIVHGVLHLLGYDHLSDSEQAQMEGMETRLLCGLGFPPPFEE